jgi:hypothetical protein
MRQSTGDTMIRTVLPLTMLLLASAASADDARPSMLYYGSATMNADGSLTLRLDRTASGKAVDTVLTFSPGDRGYDSVRRHLGISPGQTRTVTPWKD